MNVQAKTKRFFPGLVKGDNDKVHGQQEVDKCTLKIRRKLGIGVGLARSIPSFYKVECSFRFLWCTSSAKFSVPTFYAGRRVVKINSSAGL
jgi:hypothetical protein